MGRSGTTIWTARRADGAAGAGRPRERLADQRVLDRRDEVRAQALVLPAGVAEVPRVEPRVPEAPRLHLPGGPIGCRLVVGRAGEARPVHVRQEVQRPHDLRVLRPLAANLPEDLGVDALLPRGGCVLPARRQRAPDANERQHYGHASLHRAAPVSCEHENPEDDRAPPRESPFSLAVPVVIPRARCALKTVERSVVRGRTCGGRLVPARQDAIASALSKYVRAGRDKPCPYSRHARWNRSRPL